MGAKFGYTSNSRVAVEKRRRGIFLSSSALSQPSYVSYLSRHSLQHCPGNLFAYYKFKVTGSRFVRWNLMTHWNVSVAWGLTGFQPPYYVHKTGFKTTRGLEVFHVAIILNSCFRNLTLGLLLSLCSQKKRIMLSFPSYLPLSAKGLFRKCGRGAQQRQWPGSHFSIGTFINMTPLMLSVFLSVHVTCMCRVKHRSTP